MNRYALWLPIALLACMFGWLYARPTPDGAKVYYRVTVGLSHKGVPIDFDVVVGCGVKIGDDRYSGRSYDVQAWWPYVYAKAIDGGHAVLLRTDAEANPCLGNTSTRGRGPGLKEPAIPKDWLPLIVWYDKAEDLSHGLGYVTRDAYERPNSELEFHGARIDTATRADYEQFVKTAQPNLVPKDLSGFLSVPTASLVGINAPITQAIRDQPWRAWPLSSAPICRGVQRSALSNEQRARVSALWPGNHPRYWSVNASDQQALLSSLMPSRVLYPEPFAYADKISTNTPLASVFPLESDVSLRLLSAGKSNGDPLFFHSYIGKESETKGLLSCDADATSELLAAIIPNLNKKRGVKTLDVILTARAVT